MAAQNFYTHQSENVAKTWALMGAFLIIVIIIGWAASYYFQSPLILAAAVVFALLTNIWSYWNSDRVAIALSHAVPADEIAFRELHNVVENLAITAGLPKPRVYVINDAAPNAFSTGRDPKHAAVAATTGLLAMMDRTELEGVMAHELSHIGNRDILVSTVAVVLVGFATLVADFFLRASFWGFGRARNTSERSNPLASAVAVLALILAPLIATLLQLAISRKREFLADASGALLTRYPEGLANALRKLESYEAPMQHANSATAHLFIANPFGAGKERGTIAKMFSTHPPIEERIAALVGNA